MTKSNKNIAIISQSLGGGGAERFACILSELLAANYAIHHIIIEDVVDFKFSGQVYNLGKICHNNWGIVKKIKKGLLMRRYLNEHDIGTVIDNRPRNTFIRDYISKVIFANRKVIYVVHSFRLKSYFPASRFLADILYKKSFKLVCVSKTIEEEVIKHYNLQNTITIYNPVYKIVNIDPAPISENYILYFGRLDEKVKNFTLLLDAFSRSKVYQKGLRLVLLGSGPDENFIRSIILKLHLDNYVSIIPFQKNPGSYIQKARFTILTSRHEGFPLSIIESLALGIPVVAVDCKSGPSEIIINGQNGLLVPNYDAEALAIAIRRLAEESNLYHICKSNAIDSISHLSPEIIVKQWHQILSQ